jgi:predicted MFS family arabinose efflux permease
VLPGAGFPPLILVFALVGTGQIASAVSGLWFGSRNWPGPPARRLSFTLILLTGGMGLFVIATRIWLLFLAAGLFGTTVAPTIISGFMTADALGAQERRAEGLTWITAAMGLGISIGSALAGQVIDTWGTRTAFGCAAGCAALAAISAGTASAKRSTSG